MFLKETKRFKDGKEHRYWSLVENRRVDGGRKVVQRKRHAGVSSGAYKPELRAL